MTSISSSLGGLSQYSSLLLSKLTGDTGSGAQDANGAAPGTAAQPRMPSLADVLAQDDGDSNSDSGTDTQVPAQMASLLMEIQMMNTAGSAAASSNTSSQMPGAGDFSAPDANGAGSMAQGQSVSASTLTNGQDGNVTQLTQDVLNQLKGVIQAFNSGYTDTSVYGSDAPSAAGGTSA